MTSRRKTSLMIVLAAGAAVIGWLALASLRNREADNNVSKKALVSTADRQNPEAAGVAQHIGIPPEDSDPANLVPAEFVKPGLSLQALRAQAEGEALNLEKLLDDGHGEWLELAVDLNDPRPLLDLEGRFACARHIEASCTVDLRLVLHPEGDVLYASGYTNDDSDETCDEYAACLTRHYTGRSFPHSGSEPVAVVISRRTSKPGDPFFEDPEKVRSLISMMSKDLQAASESEEFDTPGFQFRYRVQELGVEAIEMMARSLEEAP